STRAKDPAERLPIEGGAIEPVVKPAVPNASRDSRVRRRPPPRQERSDALWVRLRVREHRPHDVELVARVDVDYAIATRHNEPSRFRCEAASGTAEAGARTPAHRSPEPVAGGQSRPASSSPASRTSTPS